MDNNNYNNYNPGNNQNNQYQQGYNPYLQGNNPYQQPGQHQPGYPQPVPPQPPKKKNKAPLIIGIAAGIIILILIIMIAVIALNSGKGDTYNTYNSYYSVEYTEINNGLKEIEKDFYENGKIPEKKIPILFEKQEAYLKKQKENGIIREYTVYDDSIYIEFNPDSDGNCPDPIDYIPGMYYDEDDDDNTETDYTDLDNAIKDNALSFVGARMIFRGYGDKIYYADKDYQASGLYCFDTTTGKTEKVYDITIGEDEDANICLMSQGASISTGIQYPLADADTYDINDRNFVLFDYEKGVIKDSNINSYVSEYYNDMLYTTDYGEYFSIESFPSTGIVYNSNFLFNDEENEMSPGSIIARSDAALYVFDYKPYDYQDNSLLSCSDLINLQTGEKINTQPIVSYYICDNYVYYTGSEDKLHKLDIETKSDEVITDIDDDSMLFVVTDDVIYYGEYRNEKEIEIYKRDLNTDNVEILTSGTYPMDGY